MSLEQLSGKTVLVTGAGGLIGSRITSQLRRLGARPVSVCKLDAYPHEVYRERFGVDTADPDFIVGDIAEPDLMRKVISGCDYVIHAAALADVAACTRRPLDAIDTNITGTQRVLDAVAASNRVRRMVFVSSASVYGNGSPKFAEDAAVQPMSVYGNSKAWGEYQTAAVLGGAGVSYAVVRYFSVYGEPQVVKERSHSWVVAWFAMRATLGMPLHLNGGGHQIRDMVHVDDIATGTLWALVAPDAHNETVNIGTSTGTSIRQVAELVRSHYPDVPLIETPMPPGDPEGGYASVERMETLLGWRPGVTMAEGVARYVAWLKATPEAVPGWMRQAAAA
ncbi:NAD(P)-dependent oxidoreductase [Kitasatospora purpeofusca]|uniref:NAD-dependent epimerase/dehydratase family protein n=1 Tax=Kitasatospora purpeofusca TaxID=67352 RepID=UPI002A5B0F67|nr:NAD(P)-dependent oxidoreductase [Kitasatospora purpeofusca]MDY0813998.1 NAD(P)-dependent oxidoreductase [Kitasatospora purpeofusca]